MISLSLAPLFSVASSAYAFLALRRSNYELLDWLLSFVSMSQLGRSILLLALASAAAGTVLAFAGAIRKNESLTRYARWSGLNFAYLMVIANALMITALLRRDFTVSYVAEVGSVQTSTYFTVVSLWASLNGSILLWGGVLGLYVIGLIYALGDRHKEYLPWTLGTLLAICVYFAVLVSSVADPFQATDSLLLKEMCMRYGCSNGVPLDGPGPNPLLQNHWLMAFHPPTLYLGYVGMALPFSMICGALFAGRLEAGWMTPLRRVFLVPWAFLTAGIIMGGWWSYAVLGWGGFWAWDPVENASFMPWLTGTAFLHSAMMMQRKDSLRTWTLLLGMLTFLLTLFGTFLTRSGVFNSVHAFAEGPVGPIFLGFVGFMLLFSVVLLSLRDHTLYSAENRLPSLGAGKKQTETSQGDRLQGVALVCVLAIAPTIAIALTLYYSLPDTVTLASGQVIGEIAFGEGKISWFRIAGAVGWTPILFLIPWFFWKTKNRYLGRDLSIILQNFTFCLFTFVVMLGTVYPIMAEALRDKKVSVGEPYFDKFAFPIGITLITLMAVGPALPWGRAAASKAWLRFAVPLGGGVLSVVVLYGLGISKPYVLLAIGICVFALIANFEEFLVPVVQRMRAKKEPVHTALWQVAKRGRRRFGGHIAHFGVIMAVLSMAAAKGYRHEEYFTTGPGNSHAFAEYQIEFQGTRTLEEGFRKGVLGDFTLSRNGTELGVYSPRINHYKTRMEPLPAPVSLVTWNHDLQLTLMSADEDGSFAYLRVIKTPFMMWLWFSALVIFGGTVLSVWPSMRKRRRSEKVAA